MSVLGCAALVLIAVVTTVLICGRLWHGKTCDYCAERMGWHVLERTRREQWERQQAAEVSREISTDATASIPRLLGTRY